MYCYHRDRFTILDFDNLADIAYIVAGWVAIVRQALDPTKLEKPWMSIFSAMAWLRALYSLRGETWMGPRLLPIISALKDTAAFFLVTLTCILAASHAYYNLQMREEPTPAYAAFMQVVRLGIFGDFDLFEFEGLDPTYKLNGQEWEPVDPDPGPNYVEAHILFYITGLAITIMLMNLLVGVLGKNFELYEDQSAALFLRARAKQMLELQNRPWSRISQWLSSRPLHEEKKDSPYEGKESPDEEKESPDEGKESPDEVSPDEASPHEEKIRRRLMLESLEEKDSAEEEKDSVDEKDSSGKRSKPSCAARILFRLCFGPLVPLFVYSENRLQTLVIFLGIAKHGRSGFVLLLLCSPMLFILSACLAIILTFFRLVFHMQLSGLFYAVAVSFGCCGELGDASPEDCHIGLVIRAEPPREELRSLRSEMKTQLEELQSEQKKNHQHLESQQKTRFEELQSEQKKLTKLVKELIQSKGQNSFATSEEPVSDPNCGVSR
eukprot:s2865_g11.t1